MAFTSKILLIISIIHTSYVNSIQFQIDDDWTSTLPIINDCYFNSGKFEPYVCKLNNFYQSAYQYVNQFKKVDCYELFMHSRQSFNNKIRRTIHQIVSVSSFTELMIVLYQESFFYARLMVIFIVAMALLWWIGFVIGGLIGYIVGKF